MISGGCRQGSVIVRTSVAPDRYKRAGQFHKACPGCECGCHAAARIGVPLTAQLDAERRRRLAAAGAAPVMPSKGTPEKCRRGHPRTPLTTGARGECLTCKRLPR